MDFFVYILHSEKLDRFYVGTSNDVIRRMDEHNTGHYKDSYSVKGIPWTLFLSVLCETSSQAYAVESFIKRMKSSVFIRKLKEDPELISSILKKCKGEIGTPKPRGRRT